MSNYDRHLRRKHYLRSYETSLGTSVTAANLFERVFPRMTGAEVIAACNYASLMSTSPSVPDDLRGDGVLTYLDYNNGNGSYYSSWTPADIGSDLTFWLDAQDATTMRTESGGSTQPSASGDKVGQWTSKGSVSCKMIQTQVSAPDYRPTFEPNGWQSFNVVRCDNGSANQGNTNSRFLTLADSGGSAANTSLIYLDRPFTVFTAVRLRARAAVRYIYTDNGNNLRCAPENVTPPSNIFVGVNAGGGSTRIFTTNLLTTAGLASPIIIMHQYSSGTTANGLGLRGNQDGYTDDAVDKSGGSTLTTSGTYGIPGTTDTMNKSQCDILEHFVVSHSGSAWNEAARDQAGYYLAARYNCLYNGSTYTYRGGVFSSNRRAYQVRDLLKTSFTSNPTAFLNAATSNNRSRVEELVRDRPAQGQRTSKRVTKIVFWRSADDDSQTFSDGTVNTFDDFLDKYPDADARDNLVRLVVANYDSGDDAITASTINTKLLAQPEGRRWLVGVTGSNRSVTALASNASGTWKYGFYDREIATTYRIGLSLEDWAASVLAPGSTLRTFLDDNDIQAAGVNGFIHDIETLQTFWHLQNGNKFRGTASSSTRYRFTFSGSTITTRNEGDTADLAHGFSTGDALVPIGSALPTGLSQNTFYYARNLSSTTISLHPTSADATNNTNAISPSGGTAPYYLSRECWKHVQNDTAWNSTTGNLTGGVRANIKPVLAQSVWDTWYDTTNFSAFTDERAFLYFAWMQNYWMGYMQDLADLFREYLGSSLIFSDYETARFAGSIHEYEVGAAMMTYGAGDHTGSLTTEIYGSGASTRWDWRAGTTQSTGSTTWGYFLLNMNRLKAVLSSSNKPFYPWMTNRLEASSSLGTTDKLMEELWIHTAMSADNHVFFYNAGFSAYTKQEAADEQMLFVNVMREVDELVKHRQTERDPGLELTDFADKYFAHRVYSGDKWVWRISIKPSSGVIVKTRGNTAQVLDGSTVLLTIPRASVHGRSKSTYAPNGYWVYQALE